MDSSKTGVRFGRSLPAAVVLATLTWAAAPAGAQVRVATWNISNYAGGRDQELQTSVYGVNPDNGLTMVPDVLIAQEILTATALFNLRDILNAAPGSPGDWAAAPFIDGNDSDSGLLYRTGAVQFLGLTVVSTGGFPPNHPRNVMRYDLLVLGQPAELGTIACYSSHMKAGSTSDDQARRVLEAEAIRDDAAALPAEWHVLLGGALNIQSSGEAAYQVLVGTGDAGAGRFFDPISRPGGWNNDPFFRFVHTQDPSGNGRRGTIPTTPTDAGATTAAASMRGCVSPATRWSDRSSPRPWSISQPGAVICRSIWIWRLSRTASATSTPMARWAWWTSCTCSPPGAPAPDAPRTSTRTAWSMSPTSCCCWRSGAIAPESGGDKSLRDRLRRNVHMCLREFVLVLKMVRSECGRNS
jgi:hypothetical protein